MTKYPRILVASLTLSAAAFIGLVTHESYVENAMIPTKNDKPTIGFGSTFHEDGKPVKLGERTTPVRALIKSKAHITKEEASFRKSLEEAYLHQAEFDLYMDWTYQYGTNAWINSSMRRSILAGNYAQACDDLLKYRKLTRTQDGGAGWIVIKRNTQGKPIKWEYDCSTPGNKVCSGVWERQKERHAACMEAQ